MGRNQRDEPILPHIVACSATNATDQKLPVNKAIEALEDLGITSLS